MTRITESDQTRREPVAVSLGCHVPGVALPHVDPNDTQTVLDGIKKRFACKMPIMESALQERFHRFVRNWIRTNLKPLPADSDVSVETWLASTNYPQWRKEELLKKYKAIQNPLDPRWADVKSFIKDEVYPEYKHARAINSRTDEYKTLVGPIFRLIEKQVFALPYFIKKIPVRQRPQHIINRHMKPGARYFATDFTAFEAHHKRYLYLICAFELYTYMVQNLPSGPQWLRLTGYMLGTNKCIFKLVTAYVEATKMSGEMDTSLCNGFTNLMLMLFMFKEESGEDIFPSVEGDDGLTEFFTVPPSDDLIRRMGLKLKAEVHETLETASFCGMVFDFKDRGIITDPLAELATFGWTTARYARSSSRRHMELLRAKAYSLVYQYPACPILVSLGLYGLRVTEGYRAKPFIANEYERTMWDEMFEFIREKGLPAVPPGQNTRQLVERLYKVSIDDQKKIEKYLDEKQDLAPLEIPGSDHLFPRVWQHYAHNYVSPLLNSHLMPARFCVS